MKIGIGLYGTNGHQIQQLLERHPGAELLAAACVDPSLLTPSQRDNPDIVHYGGLDEMLEDRRVEVVSLCSPYRKNQAQDAIRCLKAGKHVYAEKPCALSEDELDEIIATAGQTGRRFREMSGTAGVQPYLSMAKLVEAGTIGEVVQVFAQKSYPYFAGRPQDENVDGGLIRQAGIHAVRFVQQVAKRKVSSVSAVETRLGNPHPYGGLQMAASLLMRLDNGGVACAVVNYLNPAGFGSWGNEHLRIFGTSGFIEATDGGAGTRLVVGGKDWGEIDRSEPPRCDFDDFLAELAANGPFDPEEELHAVRVVIRAKNQMKE